MKNRKLIYWKWDEKIFQSGELDRQLDEFLKRCDFDTVYVKYNVMEISYKDEKLKQMLLKTANCLKQNGRALLLDVDPREEKDFLRKYPRAIAKHLKFVEGSLDENGKGCVFVADENDKPYALLGGWSFEKIGKCLFNTGSLTKADVYSKREIGGATFYVDAKKSTENNTFLLAVLSDLDGIDVFSTDVNDYYVEMIEYFKDFPIAGCANDEWRAGLPVKYDEKTETFYTDGLVLSESFCLKFFNEYGLDLYEELPYLAYEEKGKEERSHLLIAKYTRLLRKILKKTNDLFYDTVKKYFGKDAFVGVHPTYWGDPYFSYFDVLCNGFNWWEVKRDYAQTDEFCLYPIRLALSRKANDNVWYNMWYSAGTLQLHTYFEETWRNLKYHGKVHYLSWKCSKESNVYALSTPNSIEKVSEMEKSVEEAFSHIQSVPDSSVLVVFGMESYCDWLDQFQGVKINRGTGYGVEILECTQGIFSAYNCDMVPSSEIDNGAVRFENGVVYYGKQTYQAVVFLAPNRTSEKVKNLLNLYATTGNLIVCGEGAKEMANAKYAFETLPEAKQIIAALQILQIPTHRVAGGVEYRDGTLVFTAEGKLPTGNYFEVELTHKGQNYAFKGYDYLIIDGAGETYYGENSVITIEK